MTAILIILVIIGLIYLSHVIQKKQIDKQNQMNADRQTIPVRTDLPIANNSVVEDDDLDLFFELEVFGVTYDNEDGTSRQQILSKCEEDEDIELKRAPMKKYPNAIQVWTKHGCIGYISENDNKKLAKYMDSHGEVYNAGVSDLYKNKKGIYNCYITFDVHVKKHRR
jgi:hypothetical protein